MPHIEADRSSNANRRAANERQKFELAGHTCDGLTEFDNFGGGCTPSIGADGFISGCDDTNPVRISHCPFCGMPLNFNQK